jgi:acetyl-CoA C-acetyltransferase
VKKIKIKSSYMTPFGWLGRDMSSIMLEAVREVLHDTEPKRVRRVYAASYAPAELCRIAAPLDWTAAQIQGEFPEIHADFRGMFKTGGEALYQALEDIDTGSALDGGSVLVLGFEKMTHLPPGQTAGILSERENPHDRAYGATLPALGALVTRAYMKDYGVSESAFHQVAVKNHFNGSRNPKAQFFQRPVSLDDVAASPLVSDPLRRYHCAPVTDGAAALLLDATDGDVWYRGWGRGADLRLFQDRPDSARFVATAEASRNAQRRARVTPADIDVVEIHDAFAPFELINLEEMGFFGLGEAWRALDAGELDINAALAVNPSGGMKARGHPIGCTGIASSVEIDEQLTGRAGRRQHHDASLGMIQSVGGVSDESFVFIVDSVR